MGKVSAAQKRAIANYVKKNPDKRRYWSKRNTAKSFARMDATLEDMIDIINVFNTENETGIKANIEIVNKNQGV